VEEDGPSAVVSTWLRSVLAGDWVDPVTRAAVGFTVKSGWACAVLVSGAAASPVVVESRRVELSDPDLPDAQQPYHAGFGTARGEGKHLSTLVASVKRFGRSSVTRVIRDYQAGHNLRGAGLVVGSLIDPETIANDHIRIHALEGQLFRGVVVDAAQRCGLRSALWRERDLVAAAANALRRPEQELRDVVSQLGRALGGPWRAEHKAATLAAWLVLARQPPAGRH
jgi:hypothetical protein